MPNRDLGKEIILPEMLDGAAFNGLRAVLMEAIVHDGEVAIDAAQVERLTTPCAQLLVAFLQVRKSQNQKVRISKVSTNFHSAWGDLGLSEFFAA